MSTIRTIMPKNTPKAPLLRVAAYCRVSSDSADQKHSFGVQTEYYEQLIGGNPLWVLVDIYADEGITGTSMKNREEFNRMIADCKNGKIDRILTRSVSRFARNTVDCLETVRLLSKLGVSVLFEKEQIDTAKMSSEVILAFMSSQAQDESVSLSGNMRWSYEKRMKSGDFLGYQAPYGYQFHNGSLVIDEEEAEVVRRIFQTFLSGCSMRSIANSLQSDGVPHHGRKDAWTRTMIGGILHNERYYGDALLQKTFTTESFPRQTVRNKGQRPQYYVENSHPAIISKTTFEQARELLNKRNYKRNARQYSLSGLIYCSHCGHTFRRMGSDETPYWKCSYIYDCQCPSIRVDETDIEAMLRRTVQILCHERKAIVEPMIRRLERINEKEHGIQPRLCEVNKRISETSSQQYMLTKLQSQGILDPADFSEQNQRIAARLRQLRSERNAILSGDDDSSVLRQMKELSDWLCDINESEQHPEMTEIRRIVKRIVPKTATEIEITLTGDLKLTEYLPNTKRR